MKQRILVIVLLTALTVASVFAETLTVAVIRVEFQPDESPATAGDGQFIMSDESGLVCPEWTIDPPPHNATYFMDHLKAANNYWQKVSAGSVNIDTVNSKVFPSHPDSAYLLPQEMLYYQPYLEDFDETAKLMELSQDAIDLADAEVNFNQFTTVILTHAGMGGDFAFVLDPTPGNIPSAYLSQTDFSQYGNLQSNEGPLDDLIIIPESQNFMQYDETRSLFEDSEDPCFYQVGLNGTIALMLGFHLGLPPMYDTEEGTSLVGGFALMDQGSNNWHGIVPAYPNPYTRIKSGWVSPVPRVIGDDVDLHVDDPPVKIQISADEYYLIENRQRDLIEPAAMTTWTDTLGGDTVSVITGTSGVVVAVDEQHAGLPGNGLYIWHINKSAEFTPENPNGGAYQLVDFIEADGAQDMGHETQLIFADFLETGWWFDAWFEGNEGWLDLNRSQQDTAIHFSSRSFPGTKTSEGLDTHLRIENISANGSTMSFSIRSDRVINTDIADKLFGWGSSGTSLWGINASRDSIVSFIVDEQGLKKGAASDLSPDSLFASNPDSGFTYRYPWIAPDVLSGTKLYSLTDNQHYAFSALDSLFELRLDPDSTGLQFFALGGGGYVNTHVVAGQVTQTMAPLHPLTDFGQPTDEILFYASSESSPKPFAVVNPQIEGGDPVVVAWDGEEREPVIFGSIPTGDADIFIPVDVDEDGVFEIMMLGQDEIRIVNQAGITWNGSPFNVDRYYGNPIVAPFFNGELSLFLRHGNSYSIHSFEGELLDQGLLAPVSGSITNTARRVGDYTYVLSNKDLLYFSGQGQDLINGAWLEEQGNPLGNRTMKLSGSPFLENATTAKKSFYCYPNPVKGHKTTIRAWLSNVDEWSIEIFSVNGAQIAYAEQDVAQPFAYNEWVWDTSDVSNGVYMAHIVTGGISEIIKIAVVR